jgi:hypothetical protein
VAIRTYLIYNRSRVACNEILIVLTGCLKMVEAFD